MVTETQDGLYLFRVYYPHAGSVEITGDFTERPIAMRRDDSGWWSIALRLPPGDRVFRYIVNGQSPLPDYAAGGLARDHNGAWVSCLHVPERTGAAPRDSRRDEDPEPAQVALTTEQLGRLRAGLEVEVRLADRSPPMVVCLTCPTGSRRRTVGRAAAGRADRGAERRRAAADEHRSAGGRPV